jgi:hypothetical protein
MSTDLALKLHGTNFGIVIDATSNGKPLGEASSQALDGSRQCYSKFLKIGQETTRENKAKRKNTWIMTVNFMMRKDRFGLRGRRVVLTASNRLRTFLLTLFRRKGFRTGEIPFILACLTAIHPQNSP